MKKKYHLSKALFAIIFLSIQSLHPFAQDNYRYPFAKQDPVTDNYFGVKVTDNFRWMENLDDTITQQWFREENDFSETMLNRIPGRNAVANDLLEMRKLTAPAVTDIMARGDRFFYRKGISGGETKIYYRDGKNGVEKLLVDPALYSDGANMAVSFFSPSKDGKILAFGVMKNGNELSSIRFIEVEENRVLKDILYPAGSEGDWTPDNKGFLYSRYQNDNLNDPGQQADAKMMYHKIGTTESEDKEILSRKKYPGLGLKPGDIPFVTISNDNKYILAVASNVKWEVLTYFAPAEELLNPTINWKLLTKPSDGITTIFFNGENIFLLSNKNTPKYQLLKTTVTKPGIDAAKVVVKTGKDKIEQVYQGKDCLYLVYSDGINNTLKRFDITSQTLLPVKLPLSGTIKVRLPDPLRKDCIVTIASWKMPPVKFDIDDKLNVTKSVFDDGIVFPGTDDIVVEEIEVKSHDGTMVPLSVFYNKKIKKDGKAICMIEAYGSYGISNYPFFTPAFLVAINRGVVIAVAHVRGGGEKGEAWHLGGYKTTKPNTWRDAITCAEYLIAHKYTSSKHIALHGASAGGITAGRAITDRPDLFAAVISRVGINNPLRFEQTNNGPINAEEFGTVKDSVECMGLLEMDAYHHVKKGVAYPAVICTTGMNDPRVSPWQVGKFVAALQQSSVSGRPVLLSADYKAGHFAGGNNLQNLVKAEADLIAFLFWQCGHPDFQVK